MSISSEYTTFPVLNQHFIVEKKFKFIRELGAGAYGVVCAAENTETGEKVAIKKNCKLFERPILTKRALREVKLLQHFNGHKNITGILDMDIPTPENYNDIYIVQELMEADLHQIIRSGQPLSDAHYQSFIYQILCGLKYVHSANVLHRDLKPGNLLVNADCDLMICDFGLARGFVDTPDHTGFMTEYVATRWYRAPEIMLSFQSYTKAIDMWSIGCVFAELLGSKPLFKGRDYVDQLNQILYVLGTPDDETLKRIGSERANLYIRSLQKFPKIPFSQLYPNASPAALDLLEKLLAFDPAERITVEDALKHPYLQLFHDADDEPICNTIFDFSFEEVEDTETMKQMILNEVQQFRAKKNKLRLNINGLGGHKGIATPTPTSMSLRDLPTDKATQEALAADLQRTAPIGSPMNVDEQLLEKELSGQI